MHIAMRDGDAQVLDADDEHMSIGRADVVLDDERVSPRTAVVSSPG
jgi:hypothetical protein